MNNIPPEVYNQIKREMCRPEGTLFFDYSSDELFNKDNPGGLIIDITSKGHYFRLERDKDFKLNFYHSSPGTGTRVATINLKDIISAKKVFIAIGWSPEEITLSLGPRIANGQLFCAKGNLSPKQFIVDREGGIFTIGDPSVEVMGLSYYSNGKQLFTNPAIRTWHDTIKSIEILDTGESDQGFIFEVVVSNLQLSMLVTGFEVYSKTRFIELEEEGIKPDLNSLFNNFLSTKERTFNFADLIESEAKASNKTILQYFIEKNRINFQNFDACKKAYSKVYKIKFGEIGVKNQINERIRKYLSYRHQVVHVSPLTPIFNKDKMPREEPIFSNKKLIVQAKQDFSQLIEAIHSSTLKLRPL